MPNLTRSEIDILNGDPDSVDRDRSIIVKYRIEPRIQGELERQDLQTDDLWFEQIACQVMAVITLRTMLPLYYDRSRATPERAGMLIERNRLAKTIEIAIPEDLVLESTGLTHLLTLVTSPAEYNYTSQIWLDSISLPKKYREWLKGPALGVTGIRDKLCRPSRPILGLICKPSDLIRNPSCSYPAGFMAEYRKNLLAALEGGVDLLVDDLLNVDSSVFGVDERIDFFSNVTKEFNRTHPSRATGFVINLGMNPFRATEKLKNALEKEVFGVMLNAFTMGFGCIEEFRKVIDGKCAIFCTNMGSGIVSRESSSEGVRTGISEQVYSKLSRFAGADAIHAGTSASECYGNEARTTATKVMRTSAPDIKEAMAVAEGDITISNLWQNIRSFGKNFIVEPTTGIWNYPARNGRDFSPLDGARAFSLLLDELDQDMSEKQADCKVKELCDKHDFLERGFNVFGDWKSN